MYMFVQYFKVFGCLAYVFIPKEDRQNKLSAKAKEATFIGYEKGTKGYRFWSPKRRWVVISSTATFDDGIDFEETFSPVARFESVQLLLSIAALEDWEIEALDVKTAFLFEDLDEEIYLKQPEGFIKKGMENKVCHLRKAIYGLKQAAL